MRTAEDIRALVYGILEGKFRTAGVPSPDRIGEEYDFFEAGIVDSLGFVELMARLEQELGVELDLSGIPNDRLTRFHSFCEAVQAQVREQH
ncbi:MAG: acyl carrier protein [Bacteroidota bacterium]